MRAGHRATRRRSVLQILRGYAHSTRGDCSAPQRAILTIRHSHRVAHRHAGEEERLVAADDIDINVQDGTLTIQGSRPSSSIPCERYHRVERGHGAFERRFSVPAAVDVEHVTADLKDGVLTLTLPKSAATLPRRIEVS